ncbi:STAS-like domain-containing protein [Pedobacter sp. R20-19]|uniref:STAS-like domain-containing protein n=1 Tax=Pedobacter sp. R20-19 TaxID=1270196 RepID=UPI0004935B76|nr:STAS-like domain-containing protein [Pedobacter sp. R20-19]
MDTINIKFARQFTRKPGPRKIEEGDNSGELYRKQLLILVKQAIDEDKKLIIDLDGVLGYGTSFLEEMFGGLIRNNHIPYEQLSKRLSFISYEEPFLIDDINKYLQRASQWEKL